jgi:hypothetical protein
MSGSWLNLERERTNEKSKVLTYFKPEFRTANPFLAPRSIKHYLPLAYMLYLQAPAPLAETNKAAISKEQWV